MYTGFPIKSEIFKIGVHYYFTFLVTEYHRIRKFWETSWFVRKLVFFLPSNVYVDFLKYQHDAFIILYKQFVDILIQVVLHACWRKDCAIAHYICALVRIVCLIFLLGRQLGILGRQLDFRASISLINISISKIWSTNLLFWILAPCSQNFSFLRFLVLEL